MARQYNQVSENIRCLEKEDAIILDLYFQNENIYCMYLSNLFEMQYASTILEADIITADLNSINAISDFIAKSQIEVQKHDEKSVVELVNIDSSKYREGHGSRQLQKLISICKFHKVNRIYGELWDGTPIGLDNLKHFYQKNGFEIHGEHFRMNL